MSVPNVKLNELDNQVGVALALGDTIAIVGTCSSGTANVCGEYRRPKLIRDTFGKGPAVEAACALLANGFAGKVVFCKTAVTTDGGYGTIDVTGVSGTSVASNHTATAPYDEYDVQIDVVTGCTIGTTGGEYTYSLDGGLTKSPVQSLGTLNHIDITDGNVRIDLAAGTLVAGDQIKVRTTAPKWDSDDITAALAALQATSIRWAGALVTGAASAAEVATMETALATMAAADKDKWIICGARTPNIGESESTYRSSLASAFGSTTSKRIVVAAGYCLFQSPISNRRYRRSAAWPIAGRTIAIPAGVDPAAVKLGPLPTTIQILDDTGNPLEHDEYNDPGLDDERFATLRTWPGRRGTFINNAKLMSPDGSDFVHIPHRRVINAACAIVRERLQYYSSADLLIDPDTGFLLEEEIVSIEEDINARLDTGIVKTRFASAARFTMSRDDNVLSTAKLTGAAKVVPLAYPKEFDIDVGFYNPALSAKAVA